MIKTKTQRLKHLQQLLIIFVLSVFLSSCQLVDNFIMVDPYVVEDHELLAPNMTFKKVNLSPLLHVSDLYEIDDEAQLALLIMKQFEQGESQTKYVTSNDLLLQRVVLYLELIFHENFSLQAGVIKYEHFLNFDQQDVHFVELIMDENQHTFNKKRVSTLVDSLRLKNAWLLNQIEHVHDYLVMHTAYDVSIQEVDVSDYPDHPSFSPYGVHKYSKAVCSGYARAFMQMMHTVSVPTIMASSQIMNHAWNMVYVDGEWLHIDLTWNDPVPDEQNRVLHTYYLLTTKEFLEKGHHEFDESSSTSLSIDDIIEFANYAFGID